MFKGFNYSCCSSGKTNGFGNWKHIKHDDLNPAFRNLRHAITATARFRTLAIVANRRDSWLGATKLNMGYLRVSENVRKVVHILPVVGCGDTAKCNFRWTSFDDL